LNKYKFISKISENTLSKEWISLKQSVLNHKDLPKFQTDYFNEVTEYNQKIDKKLEDIKLQRELASLFILVRIYNRMFL